MIRLHCVVLVDIVTGQLNDWSQDRQWQPELRPGPVRMLKKLLLQFARNSFFSGMMSCPTVYCTVAVRNMEMMNREVTMYMMGWTSLALPLTSLVMT